MQTPTVDLLDIDPLGLVEEEPAWPAGWKTAAEHLPSQHRSGRSRRVRRKHLHGQHDQQTHLSAAVEELRTLRGRLSGALRDELDEILDALDGLSGGTKHLPGQHDQSSHGRRRSGVLGSVLDQLGSLREKLSDEDRATLDRAMAQLRDLESSDVDDDDLVDDEPDGGDDGDSDEDSDLTMDSASGDVAFTPYADGDIDVDWDGGDYGFRLSPQSSREVADAVARFAALPVAEGQPATPSDRPDWVTDQETYRQWLNQLNDQWAASEAGRRHNGVLDEMTTSDGNLKVARYGSGVTWIGDPESVDDEESSGVLQLDDSDEANMFVDLLRRAIAIATPEPSAGKSASKGAPMATKSFNPTIKAVGGSGEGTATFRIASFGEVDKDGDVTQPGFFGKQPVQMVPVHDWNHVPIGKGTVYEEADGVYCDVKFNLKIPAARDWYEHIKFDMENGPALQEYCADEETEILTTRGWLRFDELTTDDQAYTLDTATGTAKFEDVLAVNIFPRQERKLRRIETGGFSSLTTADHRWPVRFNDGRSGWRTTEKLAASNGVLRTAPRVDAPTEAKWSDAFVELVAWFWNEGWRAGGRYVNIGQSTKVNAQKVAAIRGALGLAFPGRWTESTSADGMTVFRLKRDASLALMDVVGDNKAPHVDFLLSLTSAQLHLLIERCLDGDGTRHSSGVRLWYQSDPDGIRTFEMACALAGQPTASHCEKPKPDGLRPRRTVSLLRSAVAKPLDAVRVKRGSKKPPRTVAVDEWVPYEGHVWCPTTPSGTWLARRRGSIYFTGNSYGYEVLPGGSKAGQHQGRQVRFLVPRNDGTPGVKVFEVSPVLQGAGTGTGTVSVKGSGVRANRAAMGAIPAHETKTVSRIWDRTRTESALPDGARPSELRTVYAYVDPDGDPELKASYSFPHHHGIGGPANVRACLTGIANLNGPAGEELDEAERKGIYDHLAAHLKDADHEPPALRTDPGTATKNLRFGEEAAYVLASVSKLIDRASDVMAMRRTKGKAMATGTADLLSWVTDDLSRLKSLLSQPVEPEQTQPGNEPSSEDIASLMAASIARINGF